MGQGGRDLGEKTTSEDVGEVDVLRMALVLLNARLNWTNYLQRLLSLEDFGQGLASLYTESVSLESRLLNIRALDKFLQVWFNVCSSVELEGLALESEDLGGHN